MKILILGTNGFIGSHLSEAILNTTDWQIYGMDLSCDKLTHCMSYDRFHFKKADMTQEKEWVETKLKECDVVLPLVAIATPALYVNNPIRVFELDFEANLEIVRLCVQHQKRVIFPSTSEVYGMCDDEAFDEEKSNLVTGPIHKERWIYATSKQLLDRLIFAYGKHHGLSYSLFRPFNWYGPRLDNIDNPKPTGSRVLTQFIGNILRGEAINLVGGGSQKRCFTYIDDGIDALIRIIKNEGGKAHQKIFNVGNPYQNLSIKELAEKLIHILMQYFPEHAVLAKRTELVSVNPTEFYGPGYQDVQLRVPAIHAAESLLNWHPAVDIDAGLQKTLAFYLQDVRANEKARAALG